MRETKKGNAFYERNSWHHRIKILNEDYSTSYGKKGGFKTPEEARIDIKLRLISENYLDRLFAELAKITPSAGSKCQEVLSVALSDALINKYIMYNPINGTKKITRQTKNKHIEFNLKL